VKTFNGISSAKALVRCEKAIGYKFQNRKLLQAGLTHASGANSRLESNERLEFLGDAILALVVCSELYRKFPGALEGELTKIKSAVVSRRACAKVSKTLGLDEVIFLGKGMVTRSSLPMSLLAAVFESLIAAVYLDSDFKTAEKVVLELIGSVINEVSESQILQNYKSQLQQHAQRELDLSPVYEILDEQGPDHSKCFEVCVRLGKKRHGSAWGPNKKEAEQVAARKTLVELGLIKSRHKPSK